MKKHQIFHVGEDEQADAVWFAMHHTPADEIAMGHAFVNPGDKLPYPGDYVDGYTVCLRVTKIFLDPRHNHRLVLAFEEAPAYALGDGE